ncbi:hypothetical protein FACS1894123_05990 [Bacteroidia bacterium]|nr:hypothetical protein FACS1894123_05990 [Bacteroidia bacterium]
MAVLEALTQVLTDQLSDGKIVRLGDFGSFQIGLNSMGAETKEKYTASLIKTKKVLFTIVPVYRTLLFIGIPR